MKNIQLKTLPEVNETFQESKKGTTRTIERTPLIHYLKCQGYFEH